MTCTTRINQAFAFKELYNFNRGYTTNGLNQYMSAGTSSFSYDANGNLTVAGNIGYVYDVENRLVSAYGGTTVNLRYDPLGRLYETSGGFLGLTRFLYDGDELVGEYGPSGSMLRRYVHGRGVDDPMIWYEGSGVEASALRRLRTNHQGSVVAVTNNAGAPMAINAYDDWGLPNGWMTGSAADDNVGRFQYTGQAWIPELGMYYYKARFYSVTLGRFMQTDPIGYKDQMNLYAYVGNDPVNGTDPDGTQTVPGTSGITLDDWRRVADSIIKTVKSDPGILLDGAMIVADVATIPSGEAVAGIALRRGALEIAEAGTERAAGSALKPLRPSTPIGDRVRTPDNSPSNFTRLKGGQGFKDNKTGTVFQRSITNHSQSPGGEFKAGPKPGDPPTKGNKDTVSGGQDGGCLLKRDRC